MVNNPEWFEGIITITVHGVRVGTMTIRQMQPAVSSENSTSASSAPGDATTARSLNARALVRGQFTDPDDARVEFKWSYDDAPYGLLDQKPIFAAVLGGLASTAIYSPYDSIRQIKTVSADAGESPSSYWCAFYVGVEKGHVPMTYTLVTRTWRDVAGYLMNEQNRFGALILDVLVSGTKVGYGLVSEKRSRLTLALTVGQIGFPRRFKIEIRHVIFSKEQRCGTSNRMSVVVFVGWIEKTVSHRQYLQRCKRHLYRTYLRAPETSCEQS